MISVHLGVSKNAYVCAIDEVRDIVFVINGKSQITKVLRNIGIAGSKFLIVRKNSNFGDQH